MVETDHSLHNKVDRVSNLLAQVEGQLNLVATSVDVVKLQSNETRSELAQLRDDFLQYVERAERAVNVQRAEIRLGVIQDEVEHQFGHYKVVRRTATGLLQAFDIGIVSEATIQNVAEELMIQSPRYWLAPALVALGSWAGDEPDLCARSVEEAFRRAPSKTALFFALIMRRQGRMDSSLRWLRQFILAQDPRALGRDFAVILECLSQGAFGPAGRELMTTTLTDWRQQLATDSAVEEQVVRWVQEIEGYSEAPSAGRFPNLAGSCAQWAQLDEALGRAGANARVHGEYKELLQSTNQPQDRLEDAVDDILDRLVSEYDPEELPLRRELAFNAAIVSRNGDLDAAKAESDLSTAALENTLDYLTIQSMSALRPDAIGVSTATRKIAVSACADWFQGAHDRFVKGYRSVLPVDVEARFASSHSMGATVFNLPEWRASFTRPLGDLESSLESHWDGHTAPFVNSLRYDWRRAAIVPGVVVVVLLVILIASAKAAGLFIGLLIGAVWAFVLYRRYERGEKAVLEAQKTLDGLKQESVHVLRAAAAELTDWQTEFAAKNADADTLDQLIADYRTAGQGASPWEQRALTTSGR